MKKKERKKKVNYAIKMNVQLFVFLLMQVQHGLVVSAKITKT